MATITELITEYRRHATAQRRMVERRNRQHLAAGGDVNNDPIPWSERSFLANERHQEARGAIAARLQNAGHWALPDLLADEARLTRMLSWSKMSGKDNVDALARELSKTRRDIRRVTAPHVASQIAEFRRHAAAVRRITGDSPRSREALTDHRNVCTQIAEDLKFTDDTELAFALEAEHHYLLRADTFRVSGGADWLRDRLAVVRRVIRRAATWTPPVKESS